MATEFSIETPGQEVIIDMIFEAPRELVYRLYTDPGLVPRWWGPRSQITTVDMMDVSEGGQWRFVSRDADGNEYGFHGVYHEVKPPERIVDTFEFEGMPGHVLLETVTFEERDGRTHVRDESVFQTVEDRDGMLHSGMEEGSRASVERFAELLNRSY